MLVSSSQLTQHENLCTVQHGMEMALNTESSIGFKTGFTYQNTSISKGLCSRGLLEQSQQGLQVLKAERQRHPWSCETAGLQGKSGGEMSSKQVRTCKNTRDLDQYVHLGCDVQHFCFLFLYIYIYFFLLRFICCVIILRLFFQVKKEVGDVSILVNNAGIVTGKRFIESPDSLVEKTMQVNTMAHFWVMLSLQIRIKTSC